MMGKGQVRMHGKRHRGRKQSVTQTGFSLIEVVVALAVFSIGLLAIFSMQFSANAVVRGVTENITVATGKVERLMALPFTHADLTAGSHQVAQEADGIDNNLDGNLDEPGETGHLLVDWQVQEDCLGSDFQGHKCVQVHVSSIVNGKRVKEIRLDFIKANML
jgi:prepilin-type N-terminal cleavage/methylation domain-containing protein